METLFSLIVGRRGSVVLKAFLGPFLSKWYILDECHCMGTFHRRVELGECIFWVGGGGWNIFWVDKGVWRFFLDG